MRPQRHGQDHDRALDHRYRGRGGGSILLRRAVDLRAAAVPHRAQLGIGLVPEGRQVFPTSRCGKPRATAANRGAAGAVDARHGATRCSRGLASGAQQAGNRLSGGEQQMLAIGRALMTNPRLLILDEATEGLAPLIRAEIWCCLAALKGAGLSILLIDNNLGALIRLADRHYMIERGHVVWSGSSAELAAAPESSTGIWGSEKRILSLAHPRESGDRGPPPIVVGLWIP